MDEATRLIKKLLESELFELVVDEIDAHPNEKRADLRASDGNGGAYLIEVKTRATDQEFDSDLQARGVALRVVPSGRTNKMSGKIEEAAHQLMSTPSSGEPFRLVALATFQQDPHQRQVDAEQFRKTLYGIADLVIQRAENSSVDVLPCFFFTYAAFMVHPEVDGAVILWGDRTQICANPFGGRVKDFAASCLLTKYSQLGGVFDPIELERKGTALIANVREAPPDQAVMLRHIEQKYNLYSAGVIGLKLLTGGIRVSLEGPTE